MIRYFVQNVLCTGNGRAGQDRAMHRGGHASRMYRAMRRDGPGRTLTCDTEGRAGITDDSGDPQDGLGRVIQCDGKSLAGITDASCDVQGRTRPGNTVR